MSRWSNDRDNSDAAATEMAATWWPTSITVIAAPTAVRARASAAMQPVQPSTFHEWRRVADTGPWVTVRVTTWFVTRRSALAAAVGLAGRSLQPACRTSGHSRSETLILSRPVCLAADDATDPQLAYSYYTRPLSFGRSSSCSRRGSPRSARSTVKAWLSEPASESGRPDANAVVRWPAFSGAFDRAFMPVVLIRCRLGPVSATHSAVRADLY